MRCAFTGGGAEIVVFNPGVVEGAKLDLTRMQRQMRPDR